MLHAVNHHRSFAVGYIKNSFDPEKVGPFDRDKRIEPFVECLASDRFIHRQENRLDTAIVPVCNVIMSRRGAGAKMAV